MSVSVRYIVNNVDEALLFYTELLGFNVQMHPAPGFAMLVRGDLRLLLNQPGAGGAGQLQPEPGGWNRFQLEVEDIDATVASMREAGVKLRGHVISGNGGKQVIAEDPSGNPVELIQPF